MNLRNVDFTGIAYLAALAAAGFVVYRMAKGAPSVGAAVSQAAGAVVDAVNPASENNLANRAANAITATLTGDPSMTPGLWLENWIKGLGGKPGNDGDKLLQTFTALDQEDMDNGAAIIRLQRRGETLGSTVADADDMAQGIALAEMSGAAFVDFSKLRRGVFR